MDFFNKYIGKIFGDLRQTENNILFSLAYFIVKIQYIHTKYVLIDYVAGKALYKASRLKSLFGDYDMEGTEVADVAPFRLCNQFLSRYVSMIYYSNDKIEN